MTSHSSSVVILLLTLFVALPQFNNASFISDVCTKAADFDKGINRDFCVKSLQSDPKSAKATLRGLAQITINLAIKNVMRTISHMNYLHSTPEYAHLKSDLIDCQRFYFDARDSLFEAAKRINAGHEAVWPLTDAMTWMETCLDDYDTSVLDKQYADADALCAMALTFTSKHAFH